MTKTFSQYAGSLPAAAAALGAGDSVLAMQSGVVVKAAPSYIAVILDSGGSGKRFQVTVTYAGLADDGVTPLLSFGGIEVV